MKGLVPRVLIGTSLRDAGGLHRAWGSGFSVWGMNDYHAVVFAMDTLWKLW